MAVVAHHTFDVVGHRNHRDVSFLIHSLYQLASRHVATGSRSPQPDFIQAESCWWRRERSQQNPLLLAADPASRPALFRSSMPNRFRLTSTAFYRLFIKGRNRNGSSRPDNLPRTYTLAGKIALDGAFLRPRYQFHVSYEAVPMIIWPGQGFSAQQSDDQVLFHTVLSHNRGESRH